MQLRTEILDNEFLESFRRFEDLVGAQTWHKRAEKVHEEIRGNPYLRDWLTGEHRFALTLDRYSTMKARHGGIAISPHLVAELDAIALVTQTLNFVDTVDPKTGGELIGRVRGAFKNPADERGLALELMVATHLQRQGAKIHVPSDGTYDWLAERDGLQFEVECKSISRNKGSQIHDRDAIELAHMITKCLGEELSDPSDCLVVEITVAERMPTIHNEKQEIAAQVRQAFLAGQNLDSPQLSVRLEHLKPGTGPAINHADGPDQESIQAFLNQKYGMDHGLFGAVYSRNGGGMMVLVVGSRAQDSLVEYTRRTLKIAAAKQLTGRRPAVLCAKFEDITADDLKEIAEERDGLPSALRIGASRLLQSEYLEKVAHVVLMADGPVIQPVPGHWTRAGLTFSFPNPKCPQHADPRLDLFRDGNRTP